MLLSALLCSSVASACAPAAQAFEIFGIKLFGSKDTGEDVADPLAYTATLEVSGADTDLRKTLETTSALVQEADRPVSGSLGLLAKARSDREQLVAALYAAARYDGVVNISIDGRPLDDIPPDAEFAGPGPIPVSIVIDPGVVFTLDEIRLEGDAAGLSPAEFGLVSGGDAGSGAILKAEAEIVLRLKAEGRPLATVTGRNVIADHATSTLDVSLTVAAGPVAGFGATSVSGAETVDSDFVAYMTGLERGTTYSPKEIKDARERLLGLGVFSSVTVQEADALDADGSLPIAVEVSERKLRYYGVGATISNTDGLGLEGYWGHRNLFGRAEKLRIEGSISGIGSTEPALRDVGDLNTLSNVLGQLNYNAAILFEKPGVIGPDSKFFSTFRTVLEHPDAYDRFSVKNSAGVSYELTDTQSVSAELALEYSDIDDFAHPDGQKHLLASIPLQYVFDNRDNRLDPKKGFRAVAFAEPAHDFLTEANFVKVRGDLSAYRALDEAGKFVVAARVSLGSVVGADLDDIPADKRFYSGGGGSVRGYAYQGIGPKDPLENPTGGRSLAEASVEMRIAVRDNIGIVPFIDAGTVSTRQFPDFSDVKVGAGVGVRYLTPFGPLRIDVAIPLNPGPGDPDYGIYAGVGQAF